MKHEDLFKEYQNKLAWIDRRLKPDVLEFYNEKAEAWKHAKEVVFQMYQHLRYFCEDGLPNETCFVYSKDLGIESLITDDGMIYPCIGTLQYRNRTFPIYNDDYGMQAFIQIDNTDIPVASFGGSVDWWYEVDKLLDNIYKNIS